MKRVLFFFPESPAGKDAGNKTRALSLLKYFKEKKFVVDFVSLDGWVAEWNDEYIETLKNTGLVDKVFILKFKPNKRDYKYWHYLFHYKIPTKSYNKKISKHPDNIVTYYMKECFSKLIQNTHYDYILINYIYWADLINDNPLVKKSKTIIDTHDFITPHHLEDPEFNVGVYVGEEIRRLNLFDEVWAISFDEYYLFDQLCRPGKVRLVPMMIGLPQISPNCEKMFDVMYVASDNPSNQESIKWFFERVYPSLPQSIRIVTIGKINRYFSDYPNVVKVSFAEDLAYYYNRTRTVMCPMLHGTGVKVKVVEALSFGLPVICTTRGIDGLPNKIDNGCLVSDDPAKFAENIVLTLENSALYERSSKAASRLFYDAFAPDRLEAILNDVFE